MKSSSVESMTDQYGIFGSTIYIHIHLDSQFRFKIIESGEITEIEMSIHSEIFFYVHRFVENTIIFGIFE